MDPVSYLFATYLNAIQTTTQNHIKAAIGTEIESVVIEYEGTEISFQYQMWRVRKSSVCSNFKSRIGDYSECSVKASRLFTELCSELSPTESSGLEYTQTRNMYCNAAASYKPTIATIGTEIPESELLQAKKNCNVATIEAMGSSDPAAIGYRDRTCQKYNELK